MRLIIMMMGSLLLLSLAHARQDLAHWQWEKQHDLPVFWDNIESSPEWVDGQEPIHLWGDHLDKISLQAGEWTVVEVPAKQWLKILNTDEPHAIKHLQVSRSLDSQTFIDEPVNTQAHPEQQITTQRFPRLSWVKITNPIQNQQDVEIAVFSSRPISAKTYLDYHHPLTPIEPVDAIELRNINKKSPHWLLSPRQSLSFEVEGPQRIQVASRLKLEPHLRSAFEPYVIQTQLDDQPLARLELETGDERRQLISINDCRLPLARRQLGFIDIPEGEHVLRLSADALQYVELLASRGADDYVFNDNLPATWQGQKDQNVSLWDQTATQQSVLLTQSVWIDEIESAAQSLARDTQHSAGSLAAKQSLLQAGAYDFEHQRRKGTVDHQFPHLKHWVDLLPLIGHQAHQQRVLGITPLALSREKIKQETLIWHQQLIRLASQQTRVHFIQLSNQGDGLDYRLSQSQTERRLRVYFLAKDGLKVRLTLGGQAARWITKESIQAQGEVVLSASAADLSRAILHEPVIATGYVPQWIEVTVPAGVDRLNIRDTNAPVWLGLQLEQAKGYLPTERDYLARLDAADIDEVRQAFFSLLTRDLKPIQTDRLMKERDNQWLPLVRFLQLQDRYFQKTPLNAYSVATDHSLSLPQRIRLARRAYTQRDYVQSIEHWSHAIGLSRPSQKDALRLKRVDALLNNGNRHFAYKQWWDLVLYGSNSVVREEAKQAMIGQADPAGLVRLLSALLVARPSSELLKELTLALVAVGETRKALMIGLLLNSDERPLDSLLAASAKEGWWQLNQQLSEQLADDQQTPIWQGIKHVFLANYDQALLSWQKAGKAATSLVERLKSDLAIRQGLASTINSERDKALRQWLNRPSQGGKQGQWRLLKDEVIRYAGSAKLRLPELDVEQQQYLMTPTQAVRLRIKGPQTLKLLMRPIHPQTGTGSLNDWLVVRSGKGVIRLPIFNNAIDPERHILGEKTLPVGLRVIQELTLGEGMHELDVQLLGHQGLLSIQAWKESLAWHVLPPVEPYLDQVHANDWFSFQDAPFFSMYPVALRHEEETTSMSSGHFLSQFRSRNQPINAFCHAAGGYDDEPYRYVMSETFLNTRVLLANQCDLDVRQVGISEATKRMALAPLKPTRVSGLIPAENKQLYDWLWTMQHQPTSRVNLSMKAMELLASLPLNHPLQAHAATVRQYTQWQLLNNLESRAGIRRIKLTGTRPENPIARVNHVLLPPLGINQRRISGLDGLLLVLEQAQAFELRVDMVFETPQENLQQQLKLAVQLDEVARHVQFNQVNDKRSVVRMILDGSHSLSFRLLNPFAGQSVRLSFYEKNADGEWQAYPVAEQVRVYQVASHDEPLVLHVQGPTRVRIDEWRNGVTHMSYQNMASGWQVIRLNPNASQEVALFRVFELIVRTDHQSLPSLVPNTGLKPMMPLLSLTTPEHNAWGRPVDSLSLRAQEDGTWSLSLLPTSRRNIQAEDGVSAGAENFLETQITHRKYVEYLDLYHHADGLYRLREQGGHTLGLKESLLWIDVWRKVDVEISGSAFFQRPNRELGSQWSTKLQAKVSRFYQLNTQLWHKPTITGFKYGLSLDKLPLTHVLDVDQDIFTPYKYQHQQGLKFCDDLTYQPWVDTQFKTGACLTSNHNLLDADNAQLHVGARTLYKDVLFRADYKMTHRFADDDRAEASNGHKLRLEVDWLRWQTSRHGVQLGARLDHDLTSNENSFWLKATWLYSKGRYFRDMKPTELLFRHLRQRIHNDRLYGDDEMIVK